MLGDEVKKLGLSDNLVGIDLSEKMLQVSLKKGEYSLLIACDILDFLSQMTEDKKKAEVVQSSWDWNVVGMKASAILNINGVSTMNLYSLFAYDAISSAPSAIAAADVFGTIKYFNYFCLLYRFYKLFAYILILKYQCFFSLYR